MANILLRFDGAKDGPKNLHEAVECISLDPNGECWIYGKKGTFCLIHNGEDVIASIGYVCYVDGYSIQDTLSQILSSFQESQISDLKKKLIGQYVLLIKKGQSIYLFSDFMGARNVFYTDNGMVISSSFSQVENLIKTSPSDLDMYKVLEFLSLRHILYAAWLGRSTEHKRIKWLLPYEYLVIDTERSSFRLGSVVYSIDNKKQSDCSLLSNELLSALRTVVDRREFKDSQVAVSLTGGRDSRLVAAITAEKYDNVKFRTSVSSEDYNSMKDLKVAKKLARVRGVSLDVYHFQRNRDEERFREMTEGFSPWYNHCITPLNDNADNYSLGFGGVFGTELFMPIPWNSIDELVERGIERTRRYLKVEDSFWTHFRDALFDEFLRIKKHYQLEKNDEQDYIRLFNLLVTARYGSFILSSFNRKGYQLEPYGSHAVFDLAFRVAPTLWGNHRRLGGDARVQQSAMAKINLRMAKVLTYASYRPMMPLSITAFPLYMLGGILQAGDILRRKFNRRLTGSSRTDLPGGYYLSNGWEGPFLRRTKDKYGMQFKTFFN